MKFGDFFASAATARAVNPKPITFTAIAKEKTLPDGSINKHGQVAARVTACLVFIGGDGLAQARVDARRALLRFVDPETKLPIATTEDDYNVELTYQVIWRALRELHEDPAAGRTAGDALFPSVDAVRKFVEMGEANRIFRAYNAYVDEEHPEGAIEQKTFRGPQG